MVDNLFIVESPLQALVAVELSLQFSGQNNAIIYRLSGKGRERNDEQILKVVARGNWAFFRQAPFSSSGGLAHHLSVRNFTLCLHKEFSGSVRNVFFGEFRSQWMHFVRLAIAPEKHVLMDDGAATLTVKRLYIDKGTFYPTGIWVSGNILKDIVKAAIYFRIFDKAQAQKPLSLASAFLKDESEFTVDFSSLRRHAEKSEPSTPNLSKKAYFFGSKYSEDGIVSRDYELRFLTGVIGFYQKKGLDFVYCSHRDESDDKLEQIKNLGCVDVLFPDLPAEIFLLERCNAVSEIGAAYSSVLNNLKLIFPDKPITSFRLERKALNPKNRDAIDHIYSYFEEHGISVESW